MLLHVPLRNGLRQRGAKIIQFLFFGTVVLRGVPNGEAKFWLEPNIEMAENYGLTRKQLGEVHAIIEGRKDEIINAWKRHLGS